MTRDADRWEEEDDTHEEGRTSGRAQEAGTRSRSGGDEAHLPHGVGGLQAAARDAIDASRALLDAVEALVDDPEVVERMSTVVRAAAGAASRAARAAEPGRVRDHGRDDDDDDDGVQRIPVA
ncbi:hypothetical protein BH24ACT4_BH24ACT4_00910 [soil metagenome]